MPIPDPIVVSKAGNGSVPESPKARPQRREGLYYVAYHPIGGDPSPEKLEELLDFLVGTDGAEIRIGPNQTVYVVNLSGDEADAVAEMTSDGAANRFQASVSCVGGKVCQAGLRDSRGLLEKLVEMDGRNGFPDGTLPTVRISGCASSCAAHQLGTLAFMGCASVEGEPAFELHYDGSHVLGKEKLGTVLGIMKEKDVPAFMEDLGKAVEASGRDFYGWSERDPSKILGIAGDRIFSL